MQMRYAAHDVVQCMLRAVSSYDAQWSACIQHVDLLHSAVAVNVHHLS